MVSIIGHRGGLGLWPENTIAGFLNAAALGVDFVELDVHLSSDGEVIVIHDATLERTTLGKGTVWSKTAADLTRIPIRDAGGECLSTLDTVLATLAPGTVSVLLELKTDPLSTPYPDLEAKVIDLVEKHGMEERVRYLCFVPEVVERVRELRPQASVATPFQRPTLQMLGGLQEGDRTVPGNSRLHHQYRAPRPRALLRALSRADRSGPPRGRQGPRGRGPAPLAAAAAGAARHRLSRSGRGGPPRARAGMSAERAKGLLVLFDLDGTLAATAPDIVRSINLVLVEAGLRPLDEADAAACVGSGEGAEILIRRAFARSGKAADDAEVRRLLARYFVVYLDNICHESALYDGCAETLDGLIAAGHRLAVCTNKPTRHARALLERLGIADSFAAICGRDAFAAHKPDARHVTGTIEAADAVGRAAVLVGDTEVDLAAARNAGIPLVLARFGYGAATASPLGPEAEINHFRELPGALEALTRAAADRRQAGRAREARTFTGGP